MGDDTPLFVMVFEFVVIAPLFWLVFPLIRAVLLLPVAFTRSLGSTRWIEAVCKDPAEIKIVWRAHRDAATQVAEEIAKRLTRGYEDLTPPNAELISMTEPPGVEDLNA